MSTYLVTGGAGFIGSNIVRSLVKQGEQVRVLDNLSTGKRENLAGVLEAITFIKGDVRDPGHAQEACTGVDYVLHQAALRAVERSVDKPFETNDVNITGTLNVLLAAREAGVRRVVFASSSSVYGNTAALQHIETMVPQPASPYALTKLTGEHYCRLFAELYGLETVSLRYFNVFGPYQNPESQYSAVIPLFVSSVLHGQAPEIHWHGKQSRDFTYIDNVVQANIKAATGQHVKAGEVYNVGNGDNVSINDLYNKVQQLLGRVIEPHRTGKRAGDVERTHADIAKARQDLGYEPAISFSQGLERSISWYKENLG